MLSERSYCASTGSVEPRRKRRADAAKHPRQTPAAAPWTPRNRTAAAVLTGLPPGPALLPATPGGAPCWAAAQTCPHPRAEIPRRCAAATTDEQPPAESMEDLFNLPTSQAHRAGSGIRGQGSAGKEAQQPAWRGEPPARWGRRGAQGWL